MTFKEKAIAALEELKGDSIGIVAATIEDCQKVIGEMEDDGGWIPVTERLPEKDGDYLIWVTVPFSGSKFMTVMHYEKDSSISIWQDTTHWMPLPEPPKEVQK